MQAKYPLRGISKKIEDEESLTDEQKDKLKAFHEHHADLIHEWRRANGSKEPPIYWVKDHWEWANRKMRRKMMKVKRMS